MDADDTRTSADAAERFAAAVEGRPVPGGPDDRQLARELAVAGRLAEQGAAFDPDPEARERARRRLLAALADRAAANGPSRAS